MKLRKVLAFITASTLVLNTVVGSLPAAAEDPSAGTSEGGSPAANSWSGATGSYTYTTDGTENDNFSFELSSASEISSVTDWSGYQYMSLTITNNNSDESKMIGAGLNFNGMYRDGSWINGGKSFTCFVATNGIAPDADDAIWFDPTERTAFDAGESVTISNITFYASADDVVIYNKWYTTDNSTYIYKTQTAETEISDYFNFDLDNAGVSDWSAITYISADVSVTGKAKPSINGDGLGRNSKELENSSATLYLNLNGEKPEWVNIGADWYDDNGTCIAAGTTITISNITYSTTERDYTNVYDEWYYQSSDKSWNYKAEAKKDWVGSPNFNSSSVTDWSKIKYISADIEITGDAYPVICATDKNNTENAVTGSEITIKDASRTIYLNTNGAELQDVRLELWGFGEGDNYAAVKDGVVIKVKNITFSETERDYTNAYDEWYPVEGGWQLKISGDSTTTQDNLPVLFLDKYITFPTFTYAKVGVKVENGSAETIGIGVTDDSGKHIYHIQNTRGCAGEVTLFPTNYDGIYSNFHIYAGNVVGGTTITVSNPQFFTESTISDYKNYFNCAIEFKKGSYYFKSDGVEINEDMSGLFEIPYDGNVSNIQSITVTGFSRGLDQYGGGGITIGSENNIGSSHTFPLASTTSSCERYYIGSLSGNFLTLDISFFHGDGEVLIETIEVNEEPVELPLSTPNDILIDYSETTFTENGSNIHTIAANDVLKIETTGTLRFDLEVTPAAPRLSELEAGTYWYSLIFNDWTNLPERGWNALTSSGITEDSTIEYKITEADLEHIAKIQELIKTTTKHGEGFNFSIQGEFGLRVSNVWFTPDSDAPVPETEKFNPDEKFNAQERQEFNQKLDKSKGNQMTELEAVKNVKDKNKHEMPQGHRYDKKDKNGNDIYSLRIVKMVDKKKLAGAKSITITCYSKKYGKYVTIEAKSCYGQLSINGSICEAEEDMAFLTVVFDNIQGDDEITYTDFTINY